MIRFWTFEPSAKTVFASYSRPAVVPKVSERRKTMQNTYRRFEMHGPSGIMATMAPNIRKAWSNLRFRLVNEYGMSWYAASVYDHSDLKAV